MAIQQLKSLVEFMKNQYQTQMKYSMRLGELISKIEG